VNVRRAYEGDFEAVAALWRAFEAEVPEPPFADPDPQRELAEIRAILRDEIALLAEEDGRALGFALARRRSARRGTLTDLYVVPSARRRGVAAALVRELVELLRAEGLEYIDLEVQASNAPARAVYERWGLREHLRVLVGRLDELGARLSPRAAGASFGSIHVQSDDQAGVERAVRQFVPRLPGRSQGSIVSPPRAGWIAVHDDVCDRDPRQLRRLARELSDRMGCVVLALGVEEGAVVRFVLHERGSVVDEYLSVQEYYGPLPPGDVIALAANPRVVARLTGADPVAVRAAAVHAASPAELPPAEEVLAGIADAMGIDGAGHGWSDAPEVDDAVRIER
jgi:ribosomal protein S18 acetylase RimI-like enzyme